MSKIATLTVTAATIVAATTLAMADQRLVHGGAGTDNATCGTSSNTADVTNGPCKTLNQAYTNANNGGGGVARLVLISNSNFTETLNITNARATEIRRNNDVNPAISGPGGANAINVDAGTQSVRIFGVRIQGSSGTAVNGLQVNSVGTLELHGVEVRGFSGIGINFAPSSGPSTGSELFVFNSDIAGHGGGGILVKPSGTQIASAIIKNSQIHHSSGYGVRTDATASSSPNPIKTMISNSIIANVGNTGALSVATGAVAARTTVENTDLLNANTGAAATGANAEVILNAATIQGNSTGTNRIASGVVTTLGNNAILRNGTNIVGGLVSQALQ